MRKAAKRTSSRFVTKTSRLERRLRRRSSLSINRIPGFAQRTKSVLTRPPVPSTLMVKSATPSPFTSPETSMAPPLIA